MTAQPFSALGQLAAESEFVSRSDVIDVPLARRGWSSLRDCSVWRSDSRCAPCESVPTPEDAPCGQCGDDCEGDQERAAGLRRDHRWTRFKGPRRRA